MLYLLSSIVKIIYRMIKLWKVGKIMKKILIAIFIIIFAAISNCEAKSYYNNQTASAMKMYKNKNYTECLQVMYEVVDKDPSNVLAYYYIAISQARLGQTDKAKEAYQRVLDLNTSTQLSKYAKDGISCLDDPTTCKSEVTFSHNQKVKDAVNQEIVDQRINSVKNIINQKQNVQEVPVNYMKDFKDYSLPKNQMQNKSEIPTKEEIADALDTLKRAGYQTYMPQPQMSAEMIQQMSMINSLNNSNNNNNSMSNFMPYMMNSDSMSQMDPQLLQTMMMSSMMNGLYNDYNQK